MLLLVSLACNPSSILEFRYLVREQEESRFLKVGPLYHERGLRKRNQNNLANRLLGDKLALHRVYVLEHSKILFTNFALLRVMLRSVARSKDAVDNIRRGELQQKNS